MTSSRRSSLTRGRLHGPHCAAQAFLCGVLLLRTRHGAKDLLELNEAQLGSDIGAPFQIIASSPKLIKRQPSKTRDRERDREEAEVPTTRSHLVVYSDFAWFSNARALNLTASLMFDI